MISYLCIKPLPYGVFFEYFANLLYLITLGLSTNWLYVDSFPDFWSGEYVMASNDSFVKTQSQ